MTTTINDLKHRLAVLQHRETVSHKYSFGTVLGVGGSIGMSGAIALAGRAALVSGAGVVKLAVPDTVFNIVAGATPEIMTVPLSTNRSGRLSLDADGQIAETGKKASVLFIGPGLGRSATIDRIVEKTVGRFGNDKKMVIDADALMFLNGKRLTADGGSIILTPHSGEFARLTMRPTPPESEREARIEAAKRFASEQKVIVVLKGYRTIMTDGVQVAINTTGNPGMATAGSGDVLTGVISALLAQHCTAWDAARLGVYCHGLAGDLAASQLGQLSVTASTIIEFLPQAFTTEPQS